MNKKIVIRSISALLLLALVAGICLMATGCDDSAGGVTVTLDKTTLTMAEDERSTLTATVTPEGKVTWSSSDASIVSVSNGTLLAKMPGKVTVTATVGDAAATCEVTVTAGNNEFQFLESDTGDYAVEKGQNGVAVGFSLFTLDANGERTKVDGAEITYTIENEKIAEIKDGKIMGRMGGVTTVIATCGEVSASAQVKVYDKFISTPEDWCKMLSSRTLGEYYLLTADIDFAGKTYTGTHKGSPGSIQRNSFRSTVDGNGHTVKNIRLEGSATEYVSIFGQLYGAKIRDIRFENVVIATSGYASALATSITSDASVVENVSLDVRFESVPAVGCVLFNTTFSGNVQNIIAQVKSPSHHAKNDRVTAIYAQYGLNTKGVYVLAEGAVDECSGISTYTSAMAMAWDINSQKLLSASSWNYIGGAELPTLINK